MCSTRYLITNSCATGPCVRCSVPFVSAVHPVELQRRACREAEAVPDGQHPGGSRLPRLPMAPVSPVLALTSRGGVRLVRPTGAVFTVCRTVPGCASTHRSLADSRRAAPSPAALSSFTVRARRCAVCVFRTCSVSRRTITPVCYSRLQHSVRQHALQVGAQEPLVHHGWSQGVRWAAPSRCGYVSAL